MTVHSFAEGIGVGVAFGADESLGLVTAIAIAIHNIPEGLAISLVLVPQGVSVLRAAGWSVFSSLPQPLVAVPAFLFVAFFDGLATSCARLRRRRDALDGGGRGRPRRACTQAREDRSRSR